MPKIYATKKKDVSKRNVCKPKVRDNTFWKVSMKLSKNAVA